MAVLNHTIAHAHDKALTATFFAEILGLPPPLLLGPFAVVQVSDDTTVDFIDVDGWRSSLARTAARERSRPSPTGWSPPPWNRRRPARLPTTRVPSQIFLADVDLHHDGVLTGVVTSSAVEASASWR